MAPKKKSTRKQSVPSKRGRSGTQSQKKRSPQPTSTSANQRTVRSKKTGKRTLPDRLSRLTYVLACQLLGENGKQLITEGSKYDTIDIERDVYVGNDLFRLRLGEVEPGQADSIVTITLMASTRERLHYCCTTCDEPCRHVGAAFSLILEEKSLLGLAEPPLEDTPFELLSEQQLVDRALLERATRAKAEKFRMQSANPTRPWADYVVTSAASGKSYRVALRGEERGVSYCSCPDFRTNTLGTCKHMMYALERTRAKFSKGQRSRAPRRDSYSVHVRYVGKSTLHMSPPTKPTRAAMRIAGRFCDGPIDNVSALVRAVGKLERLGEKVLVYPDAEELIQHMLFRERMSQMVDEIRSDPARHPLREELLKTALLPYQLDGIAFAAGRGRAILADDMGLGKTIQGIGASELLAREAGISKVLIVCPASLKSQWRNEIHRFSDRDVQLVVGSADDRAVQYDSDKFFTVCNYEQVLRDYLAIERAQWDLIILDEGQRIKNWEAKTSRVIKSLKSRFALVLSGTPLENRLDELYSIVQFIDDRRLPPAFRFFHRHRIVDEFGKVIGYKNLDVLRKQLAPILLRRTRAMVLDELPPRTTDIVRIPPTEEQFELHQNHARIVSRIVRKAYITEMDMLRLRQALMMCRLAANCTYLVDKEEPFYSSKLEHLDELLGNVANDSSRKCVLFSEWTRMLDLIEPLLESHRLEFARLDGSVPQKKRQQLVTRFQQDPKCRFFITTNAGSTGLNLQAANTVINVDLPWNPAVLEQRVGRAHRMGQKNPVHVYVLVTERTMEENLLNTLSSKHDLALAALDVESQVSSVEFVSNIEEMKRRLEVLLGSAPDAPEDVSSRVEAESTVEQFAEHRQRVAAAGGELLGAVFSFLGELTSPATASAPPPSEVVQGLKESLSDCTQEDASGRLQLNVTLPDRSALDKLAETMARLLVSREQK